MEGEAESGEAV